MVYSILLSAQTPNPTGPTGDTVARVLNTASEVVATEPESISLWYLLQEGGLLMFPLLILSILTVYFFIERYMVIKNAGKTPDDFMDRVREKVVEGNIAGAQSLCKNNNGALPKMIIKGISRIGKPIDHIEKSMENAGKLEVYKMEKNLGVLSTIAGVAPMFGFLGTIAGMIILFFNIQQLGFSIENIAGGIYTKMVSSAVGLIIGLVAAVLHSILNGRINRVVNKMETASTEFLDILHEPVVK